MTGPRTTAHATGELHVDGMHELGFRDSRGTTGDEEVAGGLLDPRGGAEGRQHRGQQHEVAPVGRRRHWW